jgi:hypothetical protein
LKEVQTLSIDWRRLSQDAGFAASDEGLLIRLTDTRQQRVLVDSTDPQALRVWSVAASPSRVAAASSDESAHLLAWRRNRASDLVGFKVDGRGRLIGEAWVPVAGLDPGEWRLYVTAVAQACDRVDYLLSGRDEG